METQTNKPVHEIRIGSIKAVVWANPGPNGTWHNVSISRVYKQGEEWKQTQSFHRDDLLIVAKVADLAHTWMVENQKKEPAE